MYQHPGVYIEHVPSGLLAIEAASTSVAVFIGPVKRGPIDEPVFISNGGQFAGQFGILNDGAGGIRNEGDTADRFGYAVNAFFANGGTKAYILRVAESVAGNLSKATTDIPNPDDAARGYTISAVNEGAWGNALQVRLTTTDPSSTPDLTLGYTLEVGAELDGEFAAIETFTGLSNDSNSGQFIEKVVEDTLQGLKLSSVPSAGERVKVKHVVGENRRDDNQTASDKFCDSTVELGRRIVAAIGLRVAGIDIITKDPSVPLSDSGGVLLEVNAPPGFFYHYYKQDGTNPVANEILRRGLAL